VQVLYGLDAQGLWPEERELRRVLTQHLVLLEQVNTTAHEFALELLQGVVAHRERIDRMLEQASHNWRVERMSRVDRNVLRLAVFELGSLAVPAAVVLDEAIEIARLLGSTESSGFVNGVLGRVQELLKVRPLM